MPFLLIFALTLVFVPMGANFTNAFKYPLLLVLFVLDQKKVTFETGYGLEGIIPDAICKRIQYQSMIPEFKKGDYDAGMFAGIQRIGSTIRKEPVQEVATPKSAISWNEILPIAIAFYILIALFTFIWVVNSIQTVKNLGKYMTKYMIKNADDERLKGKPSYFIARNLLRPSKVNHEILVGQVMDYLPSELMVKGIVIPRNRAEGEFIDGKQVVDHTGQKVITYYDLADRPDILKKVYEVLDEADNSRNELLASQKQAAEERLADIMAMHSPKPKPNQPLLPPSSPASHPDF